MNERAFFRHIAEAALAEGRPLPRELAAGCRALRREPAFVGAAIAHASDGRLPRALWSLRVPHVVASAALLRPEATMAVSRRLRELPGMPDILLPLAVPLAYFAALASFQRIVLDVIVWKVAPPLGLAETSFTRLGSAFAVAVLLLGASFVLVLVGSVAGIGPRALLFRRLRASRLFASAAALVRSGLPASTAIERLSDACRVPDRDVSWFLGGTDVGADSLDALADWLAAEEVRRANRLAAASKTLIAILLASFAVAVAATVYRGIQHVSLSPPGLT